jgi:hypothetical protein
LSEITVCAAFVAATVRVTELPFVTWENEAVRVTVGLAASGALDEAAVPVPQEVVQREMSAIHATPRHEVAREKT